MEKKFCIIYFIHDDLNRIFEFNVLPKILEAKVNDQIKVIVLRNKRIVHKDRERKQYVTYETQVSEVVNNSGDLNRSKHLSDKATWQEGFDFIREYLNGESTDYAIGLIILSHAIGFVLNRNNETLPIRGFSQRIKSFIKRVRNRLAGKTSRYFIKSFAGGEKFIRTKTIVRSDSAGKSTIDGKQIFATEFTRQGGSEYCKKYEGLFTAELSGFLINRFKEKQRKFAFIIFVNCDILLYDNGYLFAPVADYVMGAQSFCDVSFWDFPTIIHSVSLRLEDSLDQICIEIFESCEKNYLKENSDKTKHYFLARTENFSKLHYLFEKIIKSVVEMARNEKFRQDLISWISQATSTSQNNLIGLFDILDFFSAVDALSNKSLSGEIADMKGILSDMVIMKKAFPDTLHSGFSLYLPRSKDEYDKLKGPLCNYFDPSVNNAFSKNSSYDELLKTLFDN